MMIEDARLGASFYIWLAVAAGVRELQPDQQVVGRSHRLTMLIYQSFAQSSDIIASMLIQQKLIRVCATVVSDGNRFAAPDQLGPASTEIPPAPFGQRCRFPVYSPVPSFHWMDREAITARLSVNIKRLCERRAVTFNHLGITWNGNAVFTQMTLKCCDIVNAAEM